MCHYKSGKDMLCLYLNNNEESNLFKGKSLRLGGSKQLYEQNDTFIVTHNMQQAARVSDETAFFNLKAQGEPGHLVEIGPTERIFHNPEKKATEDYITGRFG